MKLIDRFSSSEVPAWCADLDERDLEIAHQTDGAMYLVDVKSSFPLKRGFLSKSHYVFRFKYISSKGSTFYFVGLEEKAPAHTGGLEIKMVPGIHILKAATIKESNLIPCKWRDDIMAFQGPNDPLFRVVELAKRREQKNAPTYVAFIG
jgi:hypothetical protein